MGTPGRVSQLLNNHQAFQTYIQNLQYLVLDEVDTLVDSNIYHDLSSILPYIPKHSTKIFTSATFQPSILTQSLKDILNITQIQVISLKNTNNNEGEIK